ncbi:hypothetical protein ACEN2I_11270, partial [Flavobacterium sp. W22_SRS_FK3]|uniref:hypothetical protein n=1 Tax=Flavobacterium sp. W22_SRS_FK3 TaxID=3240275 RepID=UPI003F905A7C
YKPRCKRFIFVNKEVGTRCKRAPEGIYQIIPSTKPFPFKPNAQIRCSGCYACVFFSLYLI